MIWAGSAVVLRASFYDIDVATELRDPGGEVLITLKSPLGETSYGTPNRLSEGSYEYDFVPEQPGRWAYRVDSAGVLPGVDEGTFYVRPSRF